MSWHLVDEIGDRLEVIMVPKVEGPWDIHFVDQLLAQLEAKNGLERPLLLHAILETALGVANVDEIANASPRMQGMSLGPADLAASRRMKTTRVGGGHPGYLVRTEPDPENPDAPRPTAQQDLWHYTMARMVDACNSVGALPFYGPFGDIGDPLACEDQFRNAFLMGCVGTWSPPPQPDRHREASVQPASRRSHLGTQGHRGDAGRQRHDHARGEDAGRRHLQAVQGDGRAGKADRGTRRRIPRAVRLLGSRRTRVAAQVIFRPRAIKSFPERTSSVIPKGRSKSTKASIFSLEAVDLQD